MNGIAVIYVVDDDPSVRRGLTRLLKAAGFKVRAFASGNEFLEYGKPTENDCVVADVHMPGLNGLELQQALLADDLFVPIILMTGRDDQGARTAARASGAAGFFTKPFDDQALIDTIKFAMQSPAAR
jgi:FixJ family two-component response regulator